MLVNEGLPSPAGDPYADRIVEFWFATRAEAIGFCQNDLPGFFAVLADYLDGGASFYLLADEYDVARLAATRDRAV